MKIFETARQAAATIAIAVATALCVCTPAAAYGGLDGYELTREEVALLPDYCRHTQLIIERHGSTVEQRAWVERTGPSFLHMHHYCIAVIAIVRSHRHSNTRSDRNGYLQFAVGNLLYVVRNAEPGYVFMPEVYYRLGQAQARVGRPEEAIKALDEALRGDPRHARAAFELSQVHRARGNLSTAEQVLRAALERVPDSRLLKSALDDLKAARTAAK